MICNPSAFICLKMTRYHINKNVQTQKIPNFVQGNGTFHLVVCHHNFQERVGKRGRKLAKVNHHVNRFPLAMVVAQ